MFFLSYAATGPHAPSRREKEGGDCRCPRRILPFALAERSGMG
jgi:hypothetical protein